MLMFSLTLLDVIQDIKASNLLLSETGALKLCDFGVVEGTLHWMAQGAVHTCNVTFGVT